MQIEKFLFKFLHTVVFSLTLFLKPIFEQIFTKHFIGFLSFSEDHFQLRIEERVSAGQVQ